MITRPSKTPLVEKRLSCSYGNPGRTSQGKPGRTSLLAPFMLKTALFALVALTSIAYGTTNKRCMVCHAREDYKKLASSSSGKTLYISEAGFRTSVHGKRQCVDCHDDIEELPHEKNLHRVECVRCHYLGNVVGAPNTEKYREYEGSVHGRLAKSGDKRRAVCQDCHGTHEIRGPDSPESQVYRTKIPEDCGKCHKEVYKTYRESVHGKLDAEGNLDAPVCTDCHGEHNIRRPVDPESSVYAGNIVNTCPRCHEETRIMKKYGIDAEQVVTYRESFHGIANQFGSTTVANCASCHGFHDIRSPSDPKSSVHPSNILATCGKKNCHSSGASEKLASVRVHVWSRSRRFGLIYWVAQAYRWLIWSSIFLFICYIGFDVFWRFKERGRGGKWESGKVK